MVFCASCLSWLVQSPPCNCQNTSFHSCVCKPCSSSRFMRGGSRKKNKGGRVAGEEEEGKRREEKVKESRSRQGKGKQVCLNPFYRNHIIPENFQQKYQHKKLVILKPDGNLKVVTTSLTQQLCNIKHSYLVTLFYFSYSIASVTLYFYLDLGLNFLNLSYDNKNLGYVITFRFLIILVCDLS